MRNFRKRRSGNRAASKNNKKNAAPAGAGPDDKDKRRAPAAAGTTMAAAVMRSRKQRADRQREGAADKEGAGEVAKKGAAAAAASDEKDNSGVNMQTSGKLLEDTNVINGVTVKYAEPPESRKPRIKWRLYVFKGDEELPILYIHRQSAYLLGRDRKVADIPLDHPSCSKQHAVLQYRLIDYKVIFFGLRTKYRASVMSVKCIFATARSVTQLMKRHENFTLKGGWVVSDKILHDFGGVKISTISMPLKSVHSANCESVSSVPMDRAAGG